MSTHTADRAPLLRGPARAIARRASAVRCAIALVVAAFRSLQVVAVENGAAGNLVGVRLVALAAPLARGRRRCLGTGRGASGVEETPLEAPWVQPSLPTAVR